MNITRRNLLIGGGSSAVAAALGIGLADHFDHSQFERGLHKVGLAASPSVQIPATGAEEHSGTLNSHHMNDPVEWTLSHPTGPQPLQGIIFCLHGKGGDHRFAFDAVRVPDAASYVGLRVAVAAVDGGVDSYWHPRRSGDNPLAMLISEFVPMIRSLVGDHPQALMGWSMGGYGSLLAAERARSQFVAIAPTSPAIWLTPGATAPGAFDSPADFYANDVFSSLNALSGLAVAVACGTGDPFYSATRDLVDRVAFPHSAFFGPGFHDAAYWASVAPNQLRAIAPALS